MRRIDGRVPARAILVPRRGKMPPRRHEELPPPRVPSHGEAYVAAAGVKPFRAPERVKLLDGHEDRLLLHGAPPRRLAGPKASINLVR